MTSRPTHALSGTPPPKNSRCQIVKTAGRETWRLGGGGAHADMSVIIAEIFGLTQVQLLWVYDRCMQSPHGACSQIESSSIRLWRIKLNTAGWAFLVFLELKTHIFSSS